MEQAGFAVIEATNRPEVIAGAHASQPDLMILDLHTPGMDGLSIVTELRQDVRFALTPIIALTACAMGDQERAIAAGFSSYVTKAISISALREKILYLLESRTVLHPAGYGR